MEFEIMNNLYQLLNFYLINQVYLVLQYHEEVMLTYFVMHFYSTFY